MSAQVTKSNLLKKNLIQAMIKTLGIVSKSCEMAGCARKTFYEYYNEDPDFKDQIDDIQNIALDHVESKLFENIENGNTAEILFYLKTKGKKRGYVEHLDLTTAGQSFNKFEITVSKPENIEVINQLINKK